MLETEGDVLSMTGEAEIRFASPEDEPLVLVSTQDLYLVLSFEPGCDDHGPLLHVSRIGERSDDRETLGTLAEGGSVSVDGLQFEIDFTFVPILRLEHYPAARFALVGIVLLIVALIANWLAPPRLLWIAISQEKEQRTLVRLLALPSSGADQWLSQMAGQEVPHDDA